MIKRRHINSHLAPEPEGGYLQAIEIENAARTLYISGQIPVTRGGELPNTFADQARLAWRNVEMQLHAADMSFDDLVKVTIFLADRAFSAENQKVRADVLGDRRLALTVIVADIFDPSWFLEIEAIACS